MTNNGVWLPTNQTTCIQWHEYDWRNPQTYPKEQGEYYYIYINLFYGGNELPTVRVAQWCMAQSPDYDGITYSEFDSYGELWSGPEKGTAWAEIVLPSPPINRPIGG